MRRAILLLALPLLAAALPARAAVDVTFAEPARYSDARLNGNVRPGADESVLKQLRAHLEALGARYLRDGQVLKVEVLDIDLAGRYEPWRATAYDVRFLRDVTWPRIKLRYALESGGAAVAQGEETLADLGYLSHPEVRLASDRLGYEKRMLDEWFRARFAAQKQN
ncbi:MAG: DUF3016 domain-containing protein [Vicinamibacterales bacterium]